jgi:hypothetical protein
MLPHMWQDCMNAIESTINVGIHYLGPIGRWQFLKISYEFSLKKRQQTYIDFSFFNISSGAIHQNANRFLLIINN